tara:strand:+ start:2877 stop:3719 length:843 start_codon:yes stop_codon:yes gene_type:complete
MLFNWKLINKEDHTIISNNIKNKYFVEYFNSFIYQIYNKMVYKIIDDSLIICKPNTMMGNYNFIRYCDTNIKEDINKKLLDYGFTLRGTDIKGKKDKFGDECIYCTKTCVEKKGKSFSRFRNILNRYKLGIDTMYKIGYHEDVDNVVKKWSLINKSKHQIKLLNIIKHYLDLVNITRIYYKNQIVGFSIVEIINKNNGIIIQRLIHPDIKSIIIEPNILIHYCDCLNNPNMFLNIGASRNKNIKIAKNKLVPFHFLRINRLTSKKKFTKNDWDYFKKHLQ